MANSILTEDKKSVALINNGNIIIDLNLPKYKITEDLKGEDKISENSLKLSTPFEKDNVTSLDYETLKKYFIENNQDNITDFNLKISSKMRDIIKKTNMESARFVIRDNSIFLNNISSRDDKKENENKGNKTSLTSFIKNYFKGKSTNVKDNSNEEDEEEKFDVIRFFADVKITDKEAQESYRNRITEFINCIGYTEQTGQTALKEKLFERLVINKYESILYSNGIYKVLPEKRLVELTQKAPKALRLDYIQNYTRSIPLDVIKAKIEMDKLEVFDNYVILHYDPENISTAKTNEEKEKEVKKAKDPILFGVIAGSTNLYYIADWIDEFCDLQFDTIVEILGKEIVEKEFLTDKIK